VGKLRRQTTEQETLTLVMLQPLTGLFRLSANSEVHWNTPAVHSRPRVRL
jgi:hypothetical protein